ncbi:flavin reductase family protein [Sulfitobacter donghicola]|uniref:Flavin monooxygenase/reductase n=1 Tax=Sulfitobacter donghicola DSW-25 = KCTC 12864 = JCM 14565 TaxID=1300350 RepID=A0A073IK20_9RHOB|nr:flavin reductase family protein [Sulfitobacter donghicola]KEJ90079.1 flavin monooxygenase/reductase [Sulfitobacter donghicola DSW-25 = KCTC 12864 = JCM 14565]KIN66775.1 Actinorhodin polyketide dimerase [Sulfitobacter donghicola DSW-25 = KCTC 12864 = JCM 14565]
MSDFDPRALRNAFGAFMTGVTVVTAYDEAGEPIGFTANSFSSVSLDPPLVLVCLANSSRNYEALTKAKGFAVNILSETQKDISNTFARPVEDRFAGISWRKGPYGAPVIEGTSAWFDCSSFNVVEAGDHVILIGQVEAFEDSTKPGLGYVRGAYVTPAAEMEALANRTHLVVSALIQFQGKVLLLGNENGQLVLPEMKVGKGGATAALDKLIAASGTNAERGFIYSVYEDAARETQHISFLCQASTETASAGMFTELSPSTFGDVADPAVCTMLERFSTESRIGDFGVYYGNQVAGEVRPMTSGS